MSDKKCNWFSIIAFIFMLLSFITYELVYVSTIELMSAFNLYLTRTLVIVSLVLSIIGLYKGACRDKNTKSVRRNISTKYHYTWLSLIVIAISCFRISCFVYHWIYHELVIVPYMISE